MKTTLIYAVSWLGLVVLAIVNGWIRVRVYGPSLDELTAHQISTLIGIVLFGGYIWLLTGWFAIESIRQAKLIGGMWLVMTVLFEFGFGHYVMHHPWSKLLHDYNLLEGRVWVLVLVWTAIAPYLFHRLRQQ